MFGYESFQDLFSACSPTALVSEFTIPILSLNADDDPFTPEYGELLELSPYITSQTVTFVLNNNRAFQ